MWIDSLNAKKQKQNKNKTKKSHKYLYPMTAYQSMTSAEENLKVK